LGTEILALENIHAYYGDSHILHGVSLRLEAGTVLALLGRNGVGKSTTISSMVGFLPPRRGNVRHLGTRIERLTPEAIARRGLRLVPQGRRIFPNLSVRENLVVAAQRRGTGLPWSLDRVYDLFPPLAKRQKQIAGSLSGGEQQMLAIGRALMGNPNVLLMDEPTEGLAPLIVAEVGAAIGRLKEEGLSIVLVEQNFGLALALADQVMVLNTGQVVYEGTADAVRLDPALATRHLGVA
jgi:branched-chain amino acid transport system ATP-binding protein